MWDKTNEGKMDEEKLAKWTERVAALGVPEDKIDEHLLWIFKKVTFKLSKLRLMLDDKGIDESKAKEIIQNLVNKSNSKDLAKLREWKLKHQEKQ